MYYAIYHPYGNHTLSHADTLIRFDSKRDRDDFVTCNIDGHYKYSAISRDDARAIFPKAFEETDWYDEASMWDEYDYWTGKPTGGNYKYMN